MDTERKKYSERLEFAKFPPPDMPDEFFAGHVFELNDAEYALFMFADFRNRFLKSFIISIYSLLESSLVERCRTIQQRTAHKLSVKDLTGKGIEQSINYLVKVHGILVLGQLPEWQQIQDIRRLRNCLAHNDGRLDEGTEQLRQVQDYINREATLSVENVERYDGASREVVLSKEYCQNTLVVIERFLYIIDNAIKAATVN